MTTMEKQTVLVTGAASGMGETAARMFAEAGYAVMLADVNEAAVRSQAFPSKIGSVGVFICRFLCLKIAGND